MIIDNIPQLEELNRNMYMVSKHIITRGGKMVVGYSDLSDTAGASPPIQGALRVTTVTDTYSALSTDDLIICNKGTSFTLTIPTTITEGKVFQVKNIGAGTVTIQSSGAETIDGAASVAIIQWESITIVI